MTTLTGTIRNPNNSPIAYALVRLTLVNTGMDNQGNLYADKSSVEAYTSSNGAFTVSLWANSESILDAPYKLEVFDNNGRVIDEQMLYIPNRDNITLADAMYLYQSISNAGVTALLDKWQNTLPTYKLVTRTVSTGGSKLVSMPLGRAFEVYAVETDKPARVRVYSTHTAALQDAGRQLDSTYSPPGLVLEVVTSTQTPKLHLQPVARGADLKTLPDGNVWVRIDATTGEVVNTVKATVLLLDASDFTGQVIFSSLFDNDTTPPTDGGLITT